MIIGQEEVQRAIKCAAKDDLPILLVGETGTGKTSMILEEAGKQKKAIIRFTLSGETSVDDFVGKYILEDGKTVWQDGVLLRAMRQGYWLVVDEINAALPEILFVLHSLLDDSKEVLVAANDGEVVTPKEGFRFFATMNPVQEYAGVKALNRAFMSRFPIVKKVEYPSSKQEIQILQKKSGVGAKDAVKMVSVANKIRKMKSQEKIFEGCSTRDLIFWGNLEKEFGLEKAFTMSVLDKYFEGEEERKLVAGAYSKVFNSSMPHIESLKDDEDIYKLLEELDTLRSREKGIKKFWNEVDALRDKK